MEYFGRHYDEVLFWNFYDWDGLLFRMISTALVGGVCGVSRTRSAALSENTCAEHGSISAYMQSLQALGVHYSLHRGPLH